MSVCKPSAAYPTHSEALDVKRRLLKSHHLSVFIFHCETCDLYHLDSKTSKLRVPPKVMSVLRLVALGHSEREISQITSFPLATVRWYTAGLRQQFAALNNVNLIAAAIALGLLNPKEFVPGIGERRDCA